jgi:CRP/FNR family transcriptional regulator, cyclic AMP receptor protein
MLEALPEPGREFVLNSARRLRFGRGEMILSQGSPSASLLIIESGRVSIHLLTSTGENVILGVMGPGEVLGEMGLLMANRERTASVRAVDQVTIRALRRESFEELRRNHPSVSDFLLHLLARRADRLSQLVLEAHHIPVEQRVARRLLEVGRLFAAERLPVIVPLTQDEIAQLAGTRRPTANQILRSFQDAGLLQLERGRVELLDIAGLRRRC